MSKLLVVGGKGDIQPFYVFSSQINYKHNSPSEKIAALLELCLLGKNRTNRKLELMAIGKFP